MPRSGPIGTATPPPGTFPKNPGDVIPSSAWNQLFSDLYLIANTPTPISYGGTGQANLIFSTADFGLKDGTDPTKKLALNIAGITTATERTLTVQDKNGTIALTSDVAASNAPRNLAISATVASNALTIAVKGHDGNDPSSTNPVSVPIRSATANSGDVDVMALTAATSLVVSSGSTLGTISGVTSSLVVVLFNDGGTPRLGVINANNGQISDGIASSTAEGGAGAADASGVFYTGTAVTSKPYAVIGFITITEATAGTWATAPTSVQTQPTKVAGEEAIAYYPMLLDQPQLGLDVTGFAKVWISGFIRPRAGASPIFSLQLSSNGGGGYLTSYVVSNRDQNDTTQSLARILRTAHFLNTSEGVAPDSGVFSRFEIVIDGLNTSTHACAIFSEFYYYGISSAAWLSSSARSVSGTNAVYNYLKLFNNQANIDFREIAIKGVRA